MAPRPTDEQLVRFEGFPGGVNNRIRETETGMRDGQPGGFLRSAVNVDLSAEGKPRRREGYELLSAGMYHSLWSTPALPWALVVKNGQLTRLVGVEPLEVTLGPVDATAAMDYTYLDGFVYFSNGKDKGRVDMLGTLLPWGMDVPPQPAVSVISGLGLYEGCYHVSVSYVDVDGVEHGACEPVKVDAATNSGLEVTLVEAFPPRAAYAEVFVSKASGETLYAAGQLTAPGTLTIGAADVGIGRPVETLFKEAPFAAQLVCEFSGRIYLAVGNMLFFTDPLRYELVSPEINLFVFPTDITMLEPAHDGLYVGYESAVDFLAGTDPFDMQRRLVSAYGAVIGTARQIPGHHFDLPLDFVPVWWGQHVGFVLGQPGGQARFLTADRLATQKYGAGAMITRENEGMTQMISALRQPGGGAARATDSVVAEVRKANVE
jgi:hypothetical protein